jgi:hypothetical protein
MHTIPFKNMTRLLFLLMVLLAGITTKAQIHEKLQGKPYENLEITV